MNKAILLNLILKIVTKIKIRTKYSEVPGSVFPSGSAAGVQEWLLPHFLTALEVLWIEELLTTCVFPSDLALISSDCVFLKKKKNQ